MHEPSARKVRVFAMVDKDQAEIRSVFHNAAHKLGVFQGAAVIGHGHAARLLEFGQGSHHFSLQADGGRRNGEEPGAVRVALPCPVQHMAGNAGRIIDRFGVGHAHDRAKAAPHRCFKP